MPIAVAVDQYKRPLTRRFPFALWDERPNIVVWRVISLLALQLSFCFEVSALSGSLVSPSPE